MTPDYYAATVGERDDGEPTCPMCGVPFSDHDGLVPICRRYHRLRCEIRALINEWKSEPSNTTLDKISQLEWALDIAEKNKVQS